MAIVEQQEEDDYKPNNYTKYKSNGDRNRNLKLGKFLNEIKPYLNDIITDLQKSDTWKIQLTIAINFIYSVDSEKEQIMHSKSNNKKLYLIMV